METTITQVSPVEYELAITATADELAPDLNKALRSQRGRTQMKGFRPGKVPLQLVKKMYGDVLAYGIAERRIQQTYESEVVEGGDYDVIGQPRITQLDYAMDRDLKATIRFGVRPEFELSSLEGESLPRLDHTPSDEDVDAELRRFQEREADLIPLDDDETLGEDGYVVVDLQRLDEETGTPIIGEKEEDTSFFLDDERLKDDLKNALLGQKAGDTVRATLPHGEGDHAHTHTYAITIKEAKRREMPELDDEFVVEVTDGNFETVDELRAEIEKQLREQWDTRAREVFEGHLVERMLELNPIPVPASAVEVYLDSFVEDVKRRNEDHLPDDFNEEAFRAANRDEAERQARWMLLRDRIIENEGLEVTDEDIDAHFEAEVGDNPQITAQQMRGFYEQMPQLMGQLRQRLLSQKVFTWLGEQFEVEPMDREAFEAHLKERRERAQQAAGIADDDGFSVMDVEEETDEAEAEKAE